MASVAYRGKVEERYQANALIEHGFEPTSDISRETGFWEASKPIPELLPKVNSRYPKPRIVIAVHSPNALVETGPRVCHPEKSQHVEATRSEESVLSSPICLGIIAKYGHFLRISEEEEPTFSAGQTAWRRERDSNPRYPFRHSGFQDRLFQPLTHPSASVAAVLALSSASLQHVPRESENGRFGNRVPDMRWRIMKSPSAFTYSDRRRGNETP